MSNLTMAMYLLDRLNIHHTYEVKDGFGIVDTEDAQFWFNYHDGSYYGTITKIPELEDC